LLKTLVSARIIFCCQYKIVHKIFVRVDRCQLVG